MNAVAQKEQTAVRPKPVSAEREYIVPDVNAFETKDSYILEAEMPGVNKEGLEITLEGNVLTIIGRRQFEQEFGTAQSNLLYRESRPADFRRTFELDPVIDTAKISANMEQGILTLQLPKAEKVKPRKITVGG